MRISYWSSDVCSSDLSGCRCRAACAAPDRAMRRSFRDLRGLRLGDVHPDILDLQEFVQRSEEHTSELQSLMRISYAVFCLKKKIYHKNLKSKNYRLIDESKNLKHHVELIPEIC